MEKAKCSYCFKERFCLWRYGTLQCIPCALEVISFLLNDISSNLQALGEIAAGNTAVSPRRCDCGRVGAPLGRVCAFCAAGDLIKRLESLHQELQAVLRTCASCGDTAAYMWDNQLPLCGLCSMAAAIPLGQA